jgi:hypothetical protein
LTPEVSGATSLRHAPPLRGDLTEIADAARPPTRHPIRISAIYVGANTFHESYFVSELKHDRLGHQHRAWGDFFARFARYATFWAHYENNVYREIHLWSELLKDTYDLYRYTRSIFSPAYRSSSSGPITSWGDPWTRWPATA